MTAKPPFPGVEAVREKLRELITEDLDVDNCEAGYIVGYARGLNAGRTSREDAAMTAKPPVPSEAQYSQVCFLGDDKRDCFNKGFAVGYNARDAIARQEAFVRQVNESAERVAQWPAHKIDGAEDTIARLEAEVAELREALNREKAMCPARRTPELTERVAKAMLDRASKDPVPSYRELAQVAVDSVLGKEPSDG